jgi:ADP-ribose pyrophosphatase YjhB (NUDIX family)
MIRQLEQRLKYSNRYVEVYDDDVEFADGQRGTYIRINHPQKNGHGVVLLPLYGGEIALVRTYRYPIGQWQWALPRGFGHGPDLMQTARDELREELGASDADLNLLGFVTPDSGMLAVRVAVVAAVLKSGTLAPVDTSEVARAAWVSHAALSRRIADGEIEDAFTLAACMLALTKGLFPPSPARDRA